MVKVFTIVILLAFICILPADSYASQPIKIEMNVKGTVAQISRLTKLSEKLKSVINSEDFKKRVSSATFTYSNDSGPQVFKKISEGAELNSQPDGTWNLSYLFEKKYRKCFGFGRFKKCSAWVLGWTSASTKNVYINALKWDDRSDCGIVGTMAHEQMHKLNYGHPVSDTPTRDQSVPYSVGSIAAEICKKF